MKNLKVMLWYDVEDFITPESDDALLALIDMMDGLGIRSSLKFVAEKMRVLKERGRYDIIDRLAGHEICYHTENHSIRPTQTEYLNGHGFADGAAEFERRERRGFTDVQDISGQFPTSYGQPGASWVPQVFPVLKKWGVPTYVDSHRLINLNNEPFSYGGILNLTRMWTIMRLEFEKGGIEEAKRCFTDIIDHANELQLVSIYYHPCEFSCTEFWDGVNFRKGANPPESEWKSAPLRSVEEMHRRVNILGEFLRWTLEQPGVEYITASESCRFEKVGFDRISGDDVKVMAASLTDGPDFYLCGERSLCASEIMSLYSRYILGRQISPEFSYGPEEDVPSVICGCASPAELARAVYEQYDRVLGFKMLPRLYEIGENRLNPVDMFMNLRRAIADGVDFDAPMKLTSGDGVLVPQKYVNTSYDWAKDWVIFPVDLDASNIVRLALLQAWTLKPALF